MGGVRVPDRRPKELPHRLIKGGTRYSEVHSRSFKTCAHEVSEVVSTRCSL